MSQFDTCTTSAVVFRRATIADAAAIARAHAEGWHWGYRGLLPDDFLDGLLEPASLAFREAFWLGLLSEQPSALSVWVSEQGDRIVGFCQSGPSRDSDAGPDIAEIGALYLVPEAAGKGIGHQLFTLAVDGLRESGYTRATLWVLDGNARARRFYETAGWRPDGAEKTEPGPGVPLPQVRYRKNLR